MTEKLTYEEWYEKHTTSELKEDLERYHDFDADGEIELMLRQAYNEYLVSFLPGT
jgi:hypothetical protein